MIDCIIKGKNKRLKKRKKIKRNLKKFILFNQILIRKNSINLKYLKDYLKPIKILKTSK